MSGVILGAFGAHALKDILTDPAHLATFETGVRYQMYHAFALLVCGVLAQQRASRALRVSTILFIAGILLFSGSVYLLACRVPLGIEHWRWLGPVTPIGGLCLIAGWAGLAMHAVKRRLG